MRFVKSLVGLLIIAAVVGVDGAHAPVHAALGADPMILEIDLDLDSPGDSEFRLPLQGTGYVEIDWDYGPGANGSGCDTTYGSSGSPIDLSNTEISCDFGASTGVIQIAFSGEVPWFGGLVEYTGNDLLTEVVDWGSDVDGLGSLKGAFRGATNLVAVPNTIPNTVTELVETFKDASSFNQNLSDWNVSTVTDVTSMFLGALDFNNGCDPDDPADTTCPLDWGTDTSGVLDMNGMFSGAVSFNQDISDWDVSNVEDFGGMFSTASSFNNGCAAGVTTCALSWNTSSVTDTQWMFYQADDFNQDVSGWDLSGVTLANFMFQNTNEFNNGCAAGVFTCDLDWTLGSLVEAGGIFQGAEAFNQKVSSWDTSTMTTMSQMFLYATAFNNGCDEGIFTCPLTWDTSEVTNMGGLFQGAEAFNQDVTDFDMWDVTSTATMFAGAIAFNNGCAAGDTSCPLEFVGGNTASLTTVASMFEGATVFNQNVASWDTADVTTMHYAFSEAAAFNNGCDEDVFTCPLNWNTHLVTNMNNMLRLALKFNQNISFWDTSSVTDFGALFYSAGVFNNGCAVDDPSCSLDWGTNSATTMYQMFSGAVEFDQNLSMFDTSNVANMTGMFHSAEKFNHDVSMWDVGAVTSIDSMFRSAGVFNRDLSAWCFDESVDHDDYDTLAVSWTEPRPQFGDCGADSRATGGGGGGDTTTTTVPEVVVVGPPMTLPPVMATATGGSLPRTGTNLVTLWLTVATLGVGSVLLLARRRLRG